MSKPSKPSRYAIGGCAYRMQIHARLSASITGTAIVTTLMSQAGELDGDRGPNLAFTGVDFTHTSNLPQGRCLWIRSQLAQAELDYAVSVDSDCWYKATELATELLRIDAMHRRALDTEIGMWTAPVAQANGAVNWRVGRGDELVAPSELEFADALAGKLPIERSGWGLVVLNLAWWREHWRYPEPYIDNINTGEDMELTRGVRLRGGRVEPLPVNVGHAAFTV